MELNMDTHPFTSIFLKSLNLSINIIKLKVKETAFFKSSKFIWEVVYPIHEFYSGSPNFSVFGINGTLYCIPHNYNHF